MYTPNEYEISVAVVGAATVAVATDNGSRLVVRMLLEAARECACAGACVDHGRHYSKPMLLATECTGENNGKGPCWSQWVVGVCLRRASLATLVYGVGSAFVTSIVAVHSHRVWDRRWQ